VIHYYIFQDKDYIHSTWGELWKWF